MGASFAAAAAAGGDVPARAARAAEITVTLSEQAAGWWRVTYQPATPQRDLDLGRSLASWRAGWRDLEGARLETRQGRDFLLPMTPAGRIHEVSVLVKASALGGVKDYAPIRRLGPRTALVYTGHFWPFDHNGRRMDAAFKFKPAAGREAAAFGERLAPGEPWRSPVNHPSFVWIGPKEARMTDGPTPAGFRLFTAPDAPDWIAPYARRLAAAVFGRYETVFDRALVRPADIFIGFDAAGPEGLYRYSGDALPGQFQITLYGGGWRSDDDAARRLLSEAIAHEAAHLWQHWVRPAKADTPAWLHEGAAEAIAGEALFDIGALSADDLAAARRKARSDCARGLDYGRLARAEIPAPRTAYACGRLIVDAAAAADPNSRGPADFWRNFEAAARAAGGYDEALFFETLEMAAGAAAAARIRRFVRTPHARPAEAILRDLDPFIGKARAPLEPALDD